jgi:hypothetical protein
MSKNDEEEKINSSTFKSLVRSLRYLICNHPYIIFRVGIVSRFMETPTMTHCKALKWILWYIKGNIDFGLFYWYYNSFNLVGYSDNNWARIMDDRKSTTGFIFYMGDTTFTWSSKKQYIVTLSTCEAEYVAIISCVFHAIWLRRLLKEL